MSLGMEMNSDSVQRYFNECQTRKLDWLDRKMLGIKAGRDEIVYLSRSKNIKIVMLKKITIFPIEHPYPKEFRIKTELFTFFKNERLVRAIAQSNPFYVDPVIIEFEKRKKELEQLFGTGDYTKTGFTYRGNNFSVTLEKQGLFLSKPISYTVDLKLNC